MGASNRLEEAALIERLGEWATPLHQADMFGTRAWWSVTPDVGELQRRAACHVPELRRLEVAAALLDLPLGIPVPEASLSVRDRRVLATLPDCVVERIGSSVVRRTSPCLTVDQVVLPARTFRRGLETVTEFSTYCARSMVVPATIDLADIELAEANYYGVGVYRADAHALTELVAPEPLPLWPETPASWSFAEMLWSQIDRRLAAWLFAD